MGVKDIEKINLGGVKSEEGRRQISKAIFVSEEDEKILRELNDKGIKLEIQMVPEDVPEDAIKRIDA